jgi:integrase/recombinase XerC/integrase/recombinase XerD
MVEDHREEDETMNRALRIAESTDPRTQDQIIEELVERFIEAQDVKPSSRALYRRTLSLYFAWTVERNLDLREITRADLLAYKDSLFERGLSSLSVGSYLTVLRKYYEWTEAVKLYPNVAKGIKTPKRKQAFRKLPLTSEQASKLLAHFQDRHIEGLRDFALINLLLRTGLRTIEAANATIEDVTFKQGKRVLLVLGKGEVEKNNFVVLTDKAWEPIRAYLATRPQAKASEPLFVSVSNNSQGLKLSTRTISRIAKDGLKAIGLDSKHLTAHSLRHTLAVSILRAGGSLTDAQAVLRHANPATTQIYTRSIEEELRLKNSPEELIESFY